jgi:hypothetical protein
MHWIARTPAELKARLAFFETPSVTLGIDGETGMGREYCADCDAPEDMWKDYALENCKKPRVEWVGSEMNRCDGMAGCACRDRRIAELEKQSDALKEELRLAKAAMVKAQNLLSSTMVTFENTNKAINALRDARLRL